MEEFYITGDSGGLTLEEFEDIKMCLQALFSIRAGSQPLDRDLGIDYDRIVGYPLDVAKNMISLEIIEKVERYEPRVVVDSVEFLEIADGKLHPHIHFIKAAGR